MDFTCDKTRECRANNPFGMSKGPLYDGIDLTKAVPDTKTGVIIQGVDNELGDKLVIFQHWQDGMNAALWRLYVVYFEQGINTPRAIYNKWSGDSESAAQEQNRLSNGSKVAEIMGIDGDMLLTFTLGSLIPLCDAMLRFEDTTEVLKDYLVNIPTEMYTMAINYAQTKA